MSFKTVEVRASRPPSGDLNLIWDFPDNKTTNSAAPADMVKHWLASFEKNRDTDNARQIGDEIYRKVVTNNVASLWNQNFGDPGEPGIRVRFTFDQNAASCINGLPLNYLRSRISSLSPIIDDFLASPRISIVFKVAEPVGWGVSDQAPVDSLRVLLVCPMAQGSDLNVEAERKEILKTLAPLKNIRVEELKSGNATFHNMIQACSRNDVLYFLGHGKLKGPGNAVLFLDDGSGGLDLRNGADIAAAIFNSPIKLLTLNGCDTAALGTYACHFPAVVGIQMEITDLSAQLFTEGFLSRLAQGGQLDEAVMAGRRTIFESPAPYNQEYRKPILFMHHDNGQLLRVRPLIRFAPGSKEYNSTQAPAPNSAKLIVPGPTSTLKLILKAVSGRIPLEWDVKGLPTFMKFDPDGRTCILGRRPEDEFLGGCFLLTVTATDPDKLMGKFDFELDLGGQRPPSEKARVFAGDYLDQAFNSAEILDGSRWTKLEDCPLEIRPWGAATGDVGLNPGQSILPLVKTDPGHHRQAVELDLRVDPLPPSPPGFMLVPGGDFLVGYHPDRDPGQLLNASGLRPSVVEATKRWPAGRVHVDGFCFQMHQVTNRQYQEFLNDNSAHPAPTHWKGSQAPSEILDHPVVHVPLARAQAYALWLSGRLQAKGHPFEIGLPTNWEWEKTAKLNSGSPFALFPWGDRFDPGFIHDVHTSDGELAAVSPHLFRTREGLAGWGNVREWLDGGTIDESRLLKSLRGVSFRNDGRVHALTFLQGLDLAQPDVDHQDDLGFRCVARPVKEDTPRQALVPFPGAGFVDSQGMALINPFAMARFVVSNADFKEFKPDYHFLPEETLRPVTSVSLEVARAFCRWKSGVLGRTVQLPRRTHWERACRGMESRKYPWGSDYDRYRCNSLESGWGRTVDVHQLPEGANPEGVYQLVGNTFEWLNNGATIGGGWNATCEGFGAPPYPARQTPKIGDPYTGFRYIVL